MPDRIEKEKTVVEKMIRIYCNHHHSTDKGSICPDCIFLLEYCRRRLDRCPKGNRKSSCRKCEIHCYEPVMKRRIKDVMAFAGPRMLLYHPADALSHLLHELRN